MNTNIDLNKFRSDYFPFRSTSGRLLKEGKEDENYIQINVQPHEKKSGSEAADQDWKSWKATSYVGNYLTLGIEFTNPGALSPNRK